MNHFPKHGTSQDQQEVKGGKGGKLGPPRPPPGWCVRHALPSDLQFVSLCGCKSAIAFILHSFFRDVLLMLLSSFFLLFSLKPKSNGHGQLKHEYRSSEGKMGFWTKMNRATLRSRHSGSDGAE